MGFSSIFLAATCLLLAGCGSAFLPQPTTRPVAADDLIGSWSQDGSRTMTQNARADHYTVTLHFADDGTFTQDIRWKTRDDHAQATGTWRLDGPTVILEGVLMHDFDFETNTGRWEKTFATWWMADSAGKPRLFGGLHPDPDAFSFFRLATP